MRGGRNGGEKERAERPDNPSVNECDGMWSLGSALQPATWFGLGTLWGMNECEISAQTVRHAAITDGEEKRINCSSFTNEFP